MKFTCKSQLVCGVGMLIVVTVGFWLLFTPAVFAQESEGSDTSTDNTSQDSGTGSGGSDTGGSSGSSDDSSSGGFGTDAVSDDSSSGGSGSSGSSDDSSSGESTSDDLQGDPEPSADKSPLQNFVESVFGDGSGGGPVTSGGKDFQVLFDGNTLEVVSAVDGNRFTFNVSDGGDLGSAIQMFESQVGQAVGEVTNFLDAGASQGGFLGRVFGEFGSAVKKAFEPFQQQSGGKGTFEFSLGNKIVDRFLGNAVRELQDVIPGISSVQDLFGIAEDIAKGDVRSLAGRLGKVALDQFASPLAALNKIGNIIGVDVGGAIKTTFNHIADGIGKSSNTSRSGATSAGTDRSGTSGDTGASNSSQGMAPWQPSERPTTGATTGTANNTTKVTNPTSLTVLSDITARALKAERTTTDEYRFRGSITRTLARATDAYDFDEVSNAYSTTIEHRLLVDLECNGSVEITKKFSTPYYRLVPKAKGAEVLVSEYAKIPRAGAHCFAFEADIGKDFKESNEQNNRSAWRKFITGFTNDTTVLQEESNKELPVFTFEAAAYNQNRILTQEWRTESITLAEGEELALRWNAPGYDTCLAFISPVTYDFSEDVAPLNRDTFAESIDLLERSDNYAVQCGGGEGTRLQIIKVTTQ